MNEVRELAARLLRSNAELVEEYEDDARKSAQSIKSGFKTVLTGFYNKGDEVNIEIPRGAISFFVGRSGGGKTTGMLNYAWRMIKQGKKGCFISAEEPAADLFAKMMALCSRAEFEDTDQWDDFYTCKKILGKKPYGGNSGGFESWRHADLFKNVFGDQLRFLDANKYLGDDILSPSHLLNPVFINEFLKEAAELGEENEFDFVMVDYAQLLNTGENFDSFAIMMKHVANGFRAIVGQHPKTSLIVGAQLTRQVAFIDFEEWMKEHIAEGSNLEKAANLILAFNMKEYDGRPMMGQRCLKYRGGNPMFQSLHDCDLRYYYISEAANHDPDAMG